MARELAREPIEEALRYAGALLDNPSWTRLTADFFGGNTIAAPGLTTELAWERPEQYLELSGRVGLAAKRHVHLPALVRALVPDPEKADERLLLLAELGFVDALGPAELGRLERRWRDGGALDGAEPDRILRHLEWMAVEPGHAGAEVAQLRIASAYERCITSAYLDPKPAVPSRSHAEARALTHALLGRLERLGRLAVSAVLDQALTLLALRTVEQWQRAWTPAGEGLRLDEHSPGPRLWGAVAAWPGLDGSRRAAYGRAARAAWIAVEAGAEEGPPLLLARTLMLTTRPLSSGAQGATADGNSALWTTAPVRGLVWLLDPEIEAVALLSARWKEQPIESLEVTLVHPDRKEPLRRTYADLLARAPSAPVDPSAPADPNIVALDERACAYRVSLPEPFGEVRVAAPVEALLLRAPPEQRPWWARGLKVAQGIHDGGAYELLDAIEQDPADGERTRVLARRAAGALWRQVRDHPAFLRVWAGARTAGELRPSVDELRAILSEPPGPLAEGDLGALLLDRVRRGCWSKRPDRLALLLQASEIPGALAALAADTRLGSNYEKRVADALDCLVRADEQPAARLARAVVLLRVAAARQPLVHLPGQAWSIDLRDILPEHFARLLDGIASGSPARDTMAACEAPLLRLCADAVGRLFSPKPLLVRDGLWLTYRLFQWLCAQLETLAPDARRAGMLALADSAPGAFPAGSIAPRDRLDPFGFDRDIFDHRLAAVLHALCAMQEVVLALPPAPPEESAGVGHGTTSPASMASEALARCLLEIAEREPGTPDVGSVLSWEAPADVPDLALQALLWIEPESLSRLSASAQRRRIDALPVEPDAGLAGSRRLGELLVLAVADHPALFAPEQRAALESRLRAMKDGPIARRWRLAVWAGLFAAGEQRLGADLRALLLEQISEDAAPVAFARLLEGLAAGDPGQVEPVVASVLAEARARGARLVPLAITGLGRLALHRDAGARAAGRRMLAALVAEPPFRDDPDMAGLLQFLKQAGDAA
ncbi:MAG: hypothetical protein HY744_09425 [Deltaproteobacteria bacterium]|nr:hypothetical protein [Deltaproteobacteria bacterium]